jgi:hypothetical protein
MQAALTRGVMTGTMALLEGSGQLLERDTDPVELGDRLDQLEDLYEAVTDGELLDLVTDLIERYRRRLAIGK